MNNIINKFLLAGDKFMPEMHLRQPRFVYSACGPFTRHKERIKEFKCTGDTRYIYRNELDKVCFQHYSAYADHKDLINRTKSDKVLRDKAYDIYTSKKMCMNDQGRIYTSSSNMFTIMIGCLVELLLVALNHS